MFYFIFWHIHFFFQIIYYCFEGLNFNFLVLLHLWNIILRKIDHVQKRLQDPTMNFKEAASDLE
jgi:hypothetical protein